MMAIAIAFYGMLATTLNRANLANKRAREVERQAHLLDAYMFGFSNGMDATIKNIQFNTNSGKFDLELTNVLKEMKNYAELEKTFVTRTN